MYLVVQPLIYSADNQNIITIEAPNCQYTCNNEEQNVDQTMHENQGVKKHKNTEAEITPVSEDKTNHGR